MKEKKWDALPYNWHNLPSTKYKNEWKLPTKKDLKKFKKHLKKSKMEERVKYEKQLLEIKHFEINMDVYSMNNEYSMEEINNSFVDWIESMNLNAAGKVIEITK